MQQTCAPLGRPRQSAATHPTDAAGPTTAKHKSNEPGQAAPSPDHGWHEKTSQHTTDWFVPLHPAASRIMPWKTYRDVDTGVSWDAP